MSRRHALLGLWLALTSKVIDLLSDSMHGLVVPPGEKIAIRLLGTAAAAQANCANVQVRIVSAEAHPVTLKTSSHNEGDSC